MPGPEWARIVPAVPSVQPEPAQTPPGGRRFEAIGLELTPAPLDVAPDLTLEQAVWAFETLWGRRWREYGPPEAELMLGRNGSFFFEPGPGMSFAVSFADRLLWILDWDKVHSRSRPSTTSEARRVHGTAIVDATNGGVLAVLQNGSELPPSAAAR